MHGLVQEANFVYQMLQPKNPTRLKNVSDILNPLVSKLSSYNKDTTDFLRKLSTLDNLQIDSLLATHDVSSLYTNISHSDGIQAARKELNKRTAAN